MAVTVNTRTIDIFGQVIAVSAITRLRVVDFTDVRGYASGRGVFVIASLIVALVGLVDRDFSSSVKSLMFLGGILAAIAVTIYCMTGPRRRLLVIEMSSGGITALAARTVRQLERLKEQMAAAIEDPPTEPRVLSMGDVHVYDLRGSRNIQVGNDDQHQNQAW